MVGQLSGKAGSTVASHGRFGSYFRTRNVPTNPNTPAQQRVRNWMTGLAQEWKTLPSLSIDAFDAYAASFSRTDSQGTVYYMSGFDAYCQVGMNVSNYAGVLTLPGAVPPNVNPPEIVTLTMTADSGGTLSLAYTVTPLAASTKLIVEATGPISAGRKFIRKSDYRQIFVSAAAAASPANILAAWEAKYGEITNFPGYQIAIRVYELTAAGTRSGYTTAQAIIS